VAAAAISYAVVQVADADLGILSKVLVVIAVGAVGFAVAWESTQVKQGRQSARTEFMTNISAKGDVRVEGINVTTPSGSSPKIFTGIKSEQGRVEISDVRMKTTPKKS
jgi:hypothetical protein